MNNAQDVHYTTVCAVAKYLTPGQSLGKYKQLVSMFSYAEDRNVDALMGCLAAASIIIPVSSHRFQTFAP